MYKHGEILWCEDGSFQQLEKCGYVFIAELTDFFNNKSDKILYLFMDVFIPIFSHSVNPFQNYLSFSQTCALF